MVIAVGAALRVWSLRTLGPNFTRDVHVAPDQQLVTTGPYRRLRHPSYTAALLLFAGIGLGQANLLSLGATIALPTAVYLQRIAVEEQELRRVLGDRYEGFARTRQRLVPWIY